jgi:hypothetical protein
VTLRTAWCALVFMLSPISVDGLDTASKTMNERLLIGHLLLHDRTLCALIGFPDVKMNHFFWARHDLAMPA